MDAIILGMPGPWADSNNEAADIYTSKIGGLPDWPFPIGSGKQNLLECSACRSNLCLFAQIYAPISSKSLSIEERVICVFGCLVPDCESPIFSSSKVLPCFYIYTQEEKQSKKAVSGSSKNTLLSVQECDYVSEDQSNGETYEEENYEYDRALNADRTYLKFKKRVDAYPEQCFRYSYGGKPLLASVEIGDPGICKHCGGLRHYEMQLMPPLIFFLQEAANDDQKISLQKIDWMTLLVYTCSMSCADSSYQFKSDGEDWIVAEETVIVQCE
ncbi:hypothetical protein CASFOL_018658 [Castilleja foliolosa]|uniref:Programmed cell death protein 2 C-terminal domain-containing protein n=1 Tax=Castilleja foliolosa TaxID=1961234 RepID=A0ABD3D5C4_9LAMI